MCLQRGDGQCAFASVFQKETDRLNVCACERVCVRVQSLSYLASAQTLHNCSDSAEVQTLIQVLWEFLLQTIQKRLMLVIKVAE